MAEDVLPLLPASRSLLVLDTLLRLLTSRNKLVRRSAFVLLCIPLYLALCLALSRVSAIRSPPIVLPLSNEPTFVPTPPTPAQADAYLRLVDRIDSSRSAYSPAHFTPPALAADSAAFVGVTAVVLAWKRTKGLQLVVKHISAYPFIREIIVWNNRGGPELVAADFVLSDPASGASILGPPILRIINSPSNVHDAGKHLACSLASYKHCYFNDDDWLNVHMDALYTHYLDCCAGGGGPGRGGSGGRIASNTMPIIHLEHQRWRFENPDVDLHTGFTWLGTGSFAPRHLSSRFIAQQSSAPVGLDRSQSLVADMFFALWANSYPEQLSNELVPIDVEGEEVGWSRSAGVDQWTVVYTNILAAVRILSDVLHSSQPHLTPNPFSLAPPPPDSHTRAPCADDRCLFSTSLTPFPSPSALVFPRQKRKKWVAGGLAEELEPRFDPWKVENVPAYEKLWDAVTGGYPPPEWWTQNGSWHLAVDGKSSDSCWESWHPPGKDDHYGLTLVVPREIHRVSLVGSENLGAILSRSDQTVGAAAWEVLTDSGSGWESRRFTTPTVVRPHAGSQFVEIEFTLVPTTAPRVRKIKFVSRGQKDERIVLCSIQLDAWLVGAG